MMPKNLSLLLILCILIFTGCSKPIAKTSAKIKLNLSKITNFSSGIGSGGAILFGKSSTGEMFGKTISSAEENIELANGAWTFYAVMWGSASSSMMGDVSCGKSVSELKGSAVNVGLNLNNANCADSEYSNGKHYVSSGKNYFAPVFIEECDDLAASDSYKCGLDNQGSALSYRFVFSSYLKKSSGDLSFANDKILGACQLVNDTVNLGNIHAYGLNTNFPTGIEGSPFIGSVELFFGNTTCDATDPKGMYSLPLTSGLAAQKAVNDKLVISNSQCAYSAGDFTGTTQQKMDKCLASYGSYSGSCLTASIPAIISKFSPLIECSTQTASNFVIKHMVSIPKPILCDKYAGQSTQIGAHPFSGGNGTLIRPYKICNEWQINQIGETNSPGYITSSFKLMNDLDMNRADFGNYAKPLCAGAPGSLLKEHHNLNSLTNLVDASCTNAATVAPYNGTFNGNGKIIKNARITAGGTINSVGFVRNLSSSGVIKNLKFRHLEIEGGDKVGGIAGELTTSSVISNITIEDSEVRANATSVGSIAGMAASGSSILKAIADDVDVRGSDKVGGLVGTGSGLIDQSMYRGGIEQYQSMMNYSVGGLIGEALSASSLTSSFSEGVIVSAAQYTGGIAGTNNGSITDSYSNMYINSKYFGANSATGGIVGSNSNSNILRVYSDSIIQYTGFGATPAIDGIVATGTFPLISTSCLSTSIMPASGCTSKSFLTLRNGTNFSAESAWKSDVVGALPRLVWEFNLNRRACLNAANLAAVSTQSGNGRGGFLNPIIICDSNQFKDLNGAAVGKYFKLGEDLNISNWVPLDMISTFSGVLDGDGYALYGLFITSANTVDHGIFLNNTGSISNMSVVGNKMIHSSTGITGLLTAVNSGVIRNITFVGNNVEGQDYVGIVAGSNTGTIDLVDVQEASVIGTTYLGGVAGYNNGFLRRASSKASLSDLISNVNYSKFGGIAGSNGPLGLIDQVVFSGQVQGKQNVAGYVASTAVEIGGIVGFNEGSISNAMTENYSSVLVRNNGRVGGLVGFNAVGATIDTSFSLGQVVNTSGTVTGGSSFHQLVGENVGTISSSTFYLENHAGGMVSFNPVDSCSAGQAIFTSTLPASLTIGSIASDLIVNVNSSSNNGKILKTFIPFAPPSSDYVVSYTPVCNPSDLFNFFKSFEPNVLGKRTIANFGDINNFASYDIAYTDYLVPANSTRQEELLEFHKAQMDGRSPVLAPPIWELEQGEPYPRLIQLDR